MLGDRIGFMKAYWVIIVIPSLPLVLYPLLNLLKKYILSMTLQDTLVSNPFSSKTDMSEDDTITDDPETNRNTMKNTNIENIEIIFDDESNTNDHNDDDNYYPIASTSNPIQRNNSNTGIMRHTSRDTLLGNINYFITNSGTSNRETILTATTNNIITNSNRDTIVANTTSSSNNNIVHSNQPIKENENVNDQNCDIEMKVITPNVNEDVTE